ncbi:MAG: TIGR03618 family F420-dependent PPOX class oxidoreductase [Chloroflexota bacterium]
MRINIVGGGPAGLFFALLMKKLDPAHEVTVHERDPAYNTYGWGIVLSERSLATLRGADFESYVELMGSAQLWKNVELVQRGERITVGGNEFSGIERLRFLNILHGRCQKLGVKLQFEANVDGLQQVSDCDLLVGADGLKSIVREAHREAFGPRTQERRNKYIWYGTPKAFHALTMIFRPHDDGLYIAHAYKFQPELSTFIVECDALTWERGGFDRRSEEQTATYLAEVFDPELGGAPLLSNRSLWYSFLLVRNTKWHHQNVVLLGDALHSVHFSIGSGTTLAVEDAIALAGSLAQEDTVQGALQAFERMRKPRVDSLQDAALDSLLWLENVKEDLNLHPLSFTYKLMTRSNRVTYRRLKQQDPGFIKRYEDWRWENEGPIHREFLDLFEKKAYAHLATLLKDGRPHVTPVYADYDGRHILINSTKGRQKDLNMERRRKVSLEITDPDQPLRYLGIQGEVVEITEEGADEHLDKLAQRYHGKERYPATWRFPGEVRRIYKIRPDKVIHWDPFGGW